MATTVIANSIVAGAMGGLSDGRFSGSALPADYASIANAAAAIAAECLVTNAALAAPMADADNAQIGILVSQIAYGLCANSGSVSVTATDYLALARQIVAASKQAVAKLA